MSQTFSGSVPNDINSRKLEPSDEVEPVWWFDHKGVEYVVVEDSLGNELVVDHDGNPIDLDSDTQQVYEELCKLIP